MKPTNVLVIRFNLSELWKIIYGRFKWCISPSRILRFCDRWIYRKIKQTPQFRKSSQIFVIAADFPQILGLDVSRDVIAMRIQSKKCFSVWKMEWTALRSHHARFTRATLDKQIESGTNTHYLFELRGADVYLLRLEPWAALDHATPLYTALGDTVKKVVRIRHRINNICQILWEAFKFGAEFC